MHVLRIFSKAFDRQSSLGKWMRVGLILHATLVLVIFSWVTWNWGSAYGDKPFLVWCILLVIDFPLGLLTILAVVALEDTLSQYQLLAVLPAVSFVVVGSIQWAVILAWYVHSREQRRAYLVCSRCGYDLRGSLAAKRCPECGQAFAMVLLGEDH